MNGHTEQTGLVRIVTDSAADLRPEVASALRITVVPLSVHFGDRVYTENEDIDRPGFYRLLHENSMPPRTSQPPAGRFEQVYRSLSAEGAEIISLHLSSRLSGTFGTAGLAAATVPEARIHLVDTLLASMAQGILVIEAAKMAAEGKSAAEILAVVASMRDRASILVIIDDLSFLQRGGRIGRAQSLLGSLLSVKPIISMEDGAVVPLLRARTSGRAIHMLATEVLGRAPLDHVQIMHGNAPEQAMQLSHLLEAKLGRAVDTDLLGPVIASHVGAGALGVVSIQAQPDARPGGEA